MNKKIFKINSVTIIFVFLIFGTLFAGCNPADTNTKKVENISESNEQAATGKQIETMPSETPAVQNKEILWDFRKADDNKMQNFPKAETDAVLKYLVGEDRDKELEITSRVSGAFTKANAKETLYYVTGCKDEKDKFVSNSTCGHVGWNSAGLIAIYDGTTPLLKIEKPLGYGIEKVTDVNGDGVNEILSFGGYTGMGIITTGGALGQISGGKYQSVKEFSGYADNCGTGDMIPANEKSVKAAVISFVPTIAGKTPDFSGEYFEGKCDGDSASKNPQWKKITKKEFDDFTEANS